MSVTDETLEATAAMRLRVAAEVDGVTQDLALAWARAWNEVSREWSDAISDLVAASQDGKWPPAGKVRRARRALAAREATRELLLGLRDMIPARVLVSLPSMLQDVTEWQRMLVATQFPPQAGGTGVVAATLERVDADALTAIVDRTTQEITSRALPLATDADAAMRSALIKGIAIGEHPYAAAAEMLRRVQGAFEGGLSRAMVIARTEMLDAHRAASRAQQDRLKDVVTGWQWVATLDTRTCFPAGTLITTRTGEKPIERIQPGDVVLTHTGAWRRAYEPMARDYSGKMVTIEANGFEVTCTSDHPILIERQGELQWMEARGVRRGDSVLSHRESGTDSGDHVLGQRAVERGRFDAKHGDASALHEGILAGVPVSGARVPVGLIDLDGQPRRGQEEVQRTPPSGHSVLLHELDTQDAQSAAHVALGFGLTGVTPVAPRRAEATPVRRDASERRAADGAVDHLRRTTTLLGAVRKSAALRIEAQAARLARRVGRICGCALDAAMVVPGCVGARNIELDATPNTGLRHAAKGGHARSRAGSGGSLRLRLEGLATVLALPLHLGLRVAALAPVGVLALMSHVAVPAAEPSRRLAPSPRRRDLEMGSAPLASKFHRHIVSRVGTHFQTLTVHNFEVEGDHSYVANGIAVHNCPSCIAMHGTEHPLSVAGPLDHQQGRCDRLPVVKSWKDLGYPDIVEPASTVPDARAWFDSLQPVEQEQILGAKRLALLRSGAIGWEDLAMRRRTDGWRPSYVPTPLKVLARRAASAA